MHTHGCISVFMYVFVYIHRCVRVCVSLCVRMQKCLHECVHACMCMHMHVLFETEGTTHSYSPPAIPVRWLACSAETSCSKTGGTVETL